MTLILIERGEETTNDVEVSSVDYVRNWGWVDESGGGEGGRKRRM